MRVAMAFFIPPSPFTNFLHQKYPTTVVPAVRTGPPVGLPDQITMGTPAL